MKIELEIFFVASAVQLLYYLFVFARLNFVRPFSYLPESLPAVSVIICAKNEAKNLRQNLKVVLIQQYKQYEVIVVNDRSDDDTIDVLVEYYRRNPNLKIVNIPVDETDSNSSGNYALIKGIEAASFDTIVITDAGCQPATTHWLAKMVGTYMSGTEAVLGYSSYEKTGGFLNKLIRYENFLATLQYFGLAKLRLPYPGNGKNISLRKNLVNLSDPNITIKNSEICIDKDAFLYSKGPETVRKWFSAQHQQFYSRFSKRFHHHALLFLFSVSGVIFYSSFLTVIIMMSAAIKVVLPIFGAVLLVKLISTFRIYKKFGVEDLIFFSPVLDVFYCGYLLIIFFLLLLKPKHNWK